jgi:hypothetical protein
MSLTFCCQMRARYIIGILAENAEMPTPSDVVDFMDFDNKAEDGRPILRIRYCPFCSKKIDGPVRVV